jgi:hypothetical protein
MNLIPILFLALGQQVTLPQEIHGQPGQFISIPSVTDCKSVQWVVLDQGLNLFPVEQTTLVNTESWPMQPKGI